MHMYMYIRMYVYTYIHMHTYKHTHTNIHTYILIDTDEYMCIHACMYACHVTHMNIDISMYVHACVLVPIIYINMHLHSFIYRGIVVDPNTSLSSTYVSCYNPYESHTIFSCVNPHESYTIFACVNPYESYTIFSYVNPYESHTTGDICQREIGVWIYVWIDAWDMWWDVMCRGTYVDLDQMSPRDSCLNLPMDWRMRQLMYDTSHLLSTHFSYNMKTHTTWESNSVIARTTTINLYAHSYKPRLSPTRQTPQLPDISCMKCRIRVDFPRLHGRCMILMFYHPYSHRHMSHVACDELVLLFLMLCV